MSERQTIHCDVESKSAIDLKKCGAYRYWESPTTDLLCMAWAIDNGPVQLWKPGEPAPAALNDAVQKGARFVAHNLNFEWLAFQHCAAPKYGFAMPELDNCYCTAAAAAAMALPRDLAGVAYALGLDVQKDMHGRRVMLQLSKPRAVNEDGTIVWWDADPEAAPKLEILYAYCKIDVEVERAVDKHVRPLSEFERRVWLLDQRINERGVPVDVENAQHARWLLYYYAEGLAARLRELTDGACVGAGQVAKLVSWLRQQGVDIEKLDRKAVTKALKEIDDDTTGGIDELDGETATDAAQKSAQVREVLQIRQDLSKSSTKKLNAFEDRCSKDRRARGNLMYFAASTGRWGGRGIQLQNLPRMQTKKVIDPKNGRMLAVNLRTPKEIEGAFNLLKFRDPDIFEQTLGSPLSVVADMLKGFIKAPAGRKFVKGDYSNIEGRVAAWLANETWKVEAFRKADRKEGPDIYLLTAAKVYDIDAGDLSKDSPERQVGKVLELACQFAGSVGAFQSMAAIYDVNVPNSKAKELITGWRDEHPAICEFWYRLEDAALHVVRNGGKAMVDSVGYAYKSGFLWAKKPNGEFLCYVDPRIRMTRRILDPKTGIGLSEIADKHGIFANPVPEGWEIQIAEHEAVTCMAVDSQTRKWTRTGLYGGLLFENFVQAIARDAMAEGMFNVERAGYPIILTVHDEIISEVDSDFGSARHFEELMVDPAPWMAGLPLRAEGDECRRYRK